MQIGDFATPLGQAIDPTNIANALNTVQSMNEKRRRNDAWLEGIKQHNMKIEQDKDYAKMAKSLSMNHPMAMYSPEEFTRFTTDLNVAQGNDGMITEMEKSGILPPEYASAARNKNKSNPHAVADDLASFAQGQYAFQRQQSAQKETEQRVIEQEAIRNEREKQERIAQEKRAEEQRIADEKRNQQYKSEEIGIAANWFKNQDPKLTMEQLSDKLYNDAAANPALRRGVPAAVNMIDQKMQAAAQAGMMNTRETNLTLREQELANKIAEAERKANAPNAALAEKARKAESLLPQFGIGSRKDFMDLFSPANKDALKNLSLFGLKEATDAPDLADQMDFRLTKQSAEATPVYDRNAKAIIDLGRNASSLFEPENSSDAIGKLIPDRVLKDVGVNMSPEEAKWYRSAPAKIPAKNAHLIDFNGKPMVAFDMSQGVGETAKGLYVFNLGMDGKPKAYRYSPPDANTSASLKEVNPADIANLAVISSKAWSEKPGDYARSLADAIANMNISGSYDMDTTNPAVFDLSQKLRSVKADAKRHLDALELTKGKSNEDHSAARIALPSLMADYARVAEILARLDSRGK